MAGDDIDIRDVKKLYYRIRGRFVKVLRDAIEPAFKEALGPVAELAESMAPRGPRRAKPAGEGFLASRIGVVVKVTQYRVLAAITPVRLGKNDYNFPYWGLFQERGYWLTSHTPKGRAGLSRREARSLGAGTKAGARRRIKFIAGHPFLLPAAQSAIPEAFERWKPLMIQAFEEISNTEAEQLGATTGGVL